MDGIAFEHMDSDIPGVRCLSMDRRKATPLDATGAEAGDEVSDGYLTEVEAACYVGVSRHTPARWAQAGLLPCVVISSTNA